MTGQVSQTAMFEAIAELLDEERAITNAAIASLDGNALLKGAAMEIMRANLRALRDRFGCIGTRQSVALEGAPPAHLKRLWEGGRHG